MITTMMPIDYSHLLPHYESVTHFSKTIPGGNTVWEGIVLITGSKGLG